MTMIEITAQDGFTLSAYRAEPSVKARGAVVVIQEIFGVTSHIRSICDDYAAQGYVAIAPCLFDRAGEKALELPYGPEGHGRGMVLAKQLDLGNAVQDIQAAVDQVSETGSVGVVGYCYGGTLAWLAAAQCNSISCVSSYYGSNVVHLLDRKPRVPTILHFGERDKSISAADIAKIHAAYPHIPVYTYPAGHAFNCNERENYDAESAKLARERTLALFEKQLG